MSFSYFDSTSISKSSLSSSSLLSSSSVSSTDDEEDVSVFLTEDDDETTSSVSGGYDCPDCDNEKTPYSDEWENGVRTHYHDEESDASNEAKNKSSHFYSPYEQHTDLVGQNKWAGSIYDNYETTTTSPEITEEEAANGVVAKETEHYTQPGYLWSLADAHSDKFTYDDGSVLINYYDNGSDLNRQVESFYSEGCDPDNPQDGDTERTVSRIYNDDGTYYETWNTLTYDSSIPGWVDDLVISTFDYIAYDAEGNAYYRGSDEYDKITGGSGGCYRRYA